MRECDSGTDHKPPRDSRAQWTCSLLLAALVVMVELTGTSCGKPEWREFSPEDSSFSVRFPSEPSLSEQTLDLPFGYASTQMYLVEAGATAFGIAITDYPGDYMAESNTRDAFDGAQRTSMANIGGRVLSALDTTRQGCASRSCSFVVGEAGARGNADMYLDGNRMYALTTVDMTRSDAPAPSSGASTFLGSFRILRRAQDVDRLSPAVQWSEFFCSEGGFRVLMPHRPQVESTALPHPDYGRLVQYRYHTAHSGLTYVVTYTDCLVAAPDEGPVVEAVCRVFAGSIGGSPIWEKDTSVGGHAGRVMQVNSSAHDAYRVLAVQAGAKTYIVMAVGPEAEVGTATADRFFNSFSLVKQ